MTLIRLLLVWCFPWARFYLVVELTLRECPRQCFVSGFYLEAISVDCIKGFFMIAVDVKRF